jgi:hypothetical protein
MDGMTFGSSPRLNLRTAKISANPEVLANPNPDINIICQQVYIHAFMPPEISNQYKGDKHSIVGAYVEFTNLKIRINSFGNGDGMCISLFLNAFRFCPMHFTPKPRRPSYCIKDAQNPPSPSRPFPCKRCPQTNRCNISSLLEAA